MSDPELKELVKQLRTELQRAAKYGCDSSRSDDHVEHVLAITEAGDLAARIWQELEARDLAKSVEEQR